MSQSASQAAAHGRSVQRLMVGGRGSALAAALTLTGLVLGVFFLLHHGGGPASPNPAATRATSEHGVAGAGIRDRFVRFSDLPRGFPYGWHGIPRDVREGSRVVGRLGGATVYSAPTHDGYWQMFNAGRSSASAGGVPWRVGNVANLRIFGGGLSKRGIFEVVSGSTLRVRGGAKLLVAYADGSRERIKVIWVSRPIGAGFFYFVIGSAHRTTPRRAVALELIRGKRLLARQALLAPRP